MTMGNGGFNPFFEHEKLSNDRQQAILMLLGVGVAAVLSVVVIIATVLR